MKNHILALAAFVLLGILNAQVPISASSRISKTEVSVMNISRNDQNAVIVTTDIDEAKKDDQFQIYMYGPTYSNGVIRIPSDGKTYWAINFNPSVQDPVKLISFGEMIVDCICNCEINACGTAVEVDGIVLCPPGSCSSWDIDADCQNCDLPVAIVIIDADIVFYNGVQYRKN